MFFTYLRRELFGRRKQTAIVAIGMAVAIALVIIVNAVTTGIHNAQSKVLESVYGVGTDITVTQTPVTPTGTDGGPQSFQFTRGSGTTSGGTQKVSQNFLSVDRGTATMPESDLDKIKATKGVSAAAATLLLENTDFSGQLAQGSASLSGGYFKRDRGTGSASGTTGGTGGTSGSFGSGQAAGQGSAPSGGSSTFVPPSLNFSRGGTDGNGGSAFSLNRFSVLGVDPTAPAVGPLSTITVTSGVGLTAADAAKDVALLDADYATSVTKKVGDTITIAGKSFKIVGLVTTSTSDSSGASNVYIPLAVAQKLATVTTTTSDSSSTDSSATSTAVVTSIYVQADKSTSVDSIQKSLESALPDATVKTQADLASSVSGSLSTASNLLDHLGKWLSIAVLIAAFLIAILFTISGVTRRTREFGTLKAIGWSNGRIVGQVAGESIVQGLIGGVIGLVLGIVGIIVINGIKPTLEGSATTSGTFTGGFAGGIPGGGFGQRAQQAAVTTAKAGTDVILHAPFTATIIVLAVVLALVGGLLAGIFGGWRATALRPAAALRSDN